MRLPSISIIASLAVLTENVTAQSCGCFTATQSVVADDCPVATCHTWSTTTVPMDDRNCPRTDTVTVGAVCPTGTACNTYWMTSFYSTPTCLAGGSGSNPTGNPRPTTTSTRVPPRTTTTTTTSTPRPPPTTMTTQPVTTSTRDRPTHTSEPSPGDDNCPTATFTLTDTPRRCSSITPDCIRFATMTIPTPKRGCGRVSSATVTTRVGSCPECTTIMQTVTAGRDSGFGEGGSITVTIN